MTALSPSRSECSPAQRQQPASALEAVASVGLPWISRWSIARRGQDCSSLPTSGRAHPTICLDEAKTASEDIAPVWLQRDRPKLPITVWGVWLGALSLSVHIQPSQRSRLAPASSGHNWRENEKKEPTEQQDHLCRAHSQSPFESPYRCDKMYSPKPLCHAAQLPVDSAGITASSPARR